MKKLTQSAGAKSQLEKPVQDLIRMIFDVESMKKAMVEFEVCSRPFSIKMISVVKRSVIATGCHFPPTD